MIPQKPGGLAHRVFYERIEIAFPSVEWNPITRKDVNALEHAKQFIQQIRREQRCNLAGVVWWRDFDQIRAHQIQAA